MLKPKDFNRPSSEKITTYTSLALNRGYTPLESSVLARMLVDADNLSTLSSYSAADRVLFTRFKSL